MHYETDHHLNQQRKSLKKILLERRGDKNMNQVYETDRGATTIPPKQPQVGEQISIQTEMISELTEILNTLETRLSGILTQPQPTEEKFKEDTSYKVAIANELHVNNTRIREIIRILHDIISRCEL
jgi:hypothetical protein